MSLKEGFLLLCRKGHDKAASRVRESHDENLDGLLNPCNTRLCFTPVHLPILSRLKFERKERRWSPMCFAPIHGVSLYARFTARIPLRLQDLEDLVGGVALFAWHLLALQYQFVNPSFPRPQYWGRAIHLSRCIGILHGKTNSMNTTGNRMLDLDIHSASFYLRMLIDLIEC